MLKNEIIYFFARPFQTAVSQSLFYFVLQENLTSWFSLPNVTGDEILFITVKIKREDNLIAEQPDS